MSSESREVSLVGVLVEEPTIKAIVEAAKQRCWPGCCVGIFLAEQGSPDLDNLVDALRDFSTPFFGGVFPGLIVGDSWYYRGALILPVPSVGAPLIVRGLNEPNFQCPDLLEKTDAPTETLFVFVDSRVSHIGSFIRRLYGQLGTTVGYLGGGVGALSSGRSRCLFSAEGSFDNAAIIVRSPLKSRPGVRHGWKSVAGPFAVTKSQGNIIYEINWLPAFELYRSVVEQHAECTLDAERFTEIAPRYPFGLMREGHEQVVREAISVSADGSLTCVGEVPENSLINVLAADHSELLAAASEAAKEASSSAPTGETKGIFIIECISRALLLGEQFGEELTLLQAELDKTSEDTPFGLLTTGEISSQGDGHLEFYNKTTIVGVLYE